MRQLNRQQHAYLEAKATLDHLNDLDAALQREYILIHNIVNPDGSVPTRSWAIDDDLVAEKAIEECCKLADESGLSARIAYARASLRAAEDDLITFGLDIIPAGMRGVYKTLRRAAATNIVHRAKLIDLIMQLDAGSAVKV